MPPAILPPIASKVPIITAALFPANKATPAPAVAATPVLAPTLAPIFQIFS
jgi:hypothetical protein